MTKEASDDNGIQLDGICCAYCIKAEQPECPIKNASGWSRWGSWCNEYKRNPDETDAGELKLDDRITCASCGSSFLPEFRRLVHVDAKMNKTFACPVCRDDLKEGE